MATTVLTAISLPPFWQPQRARRPGRSRSCVVLQSWSAPLPSPPSHFLVALRRLQEPLPQLPVRHRLIAVVEPSVLPPLLVPAPPHAVDEVGGVGVDGHKMPLLYCLQSAAGGGQLHP